MKKLSVLILAAAMLLSVAALTGCGGNKLVMATNPNFPPYEYVEEGKDTGIDIEIAQAIAAKLGKELEIVDTEFGSIIGGVQSGKYDMGMAGMTVTDERKESVNFTDSYAKARQVIVVPDKSKITDVDSLADAAGKGSIKIGVQQDTTGHIYASDDFGDDVVISYKNPADAIAALTSGKVDAVILDNEPAKSFVEANKGLKILDTAYADEDYAICVATKNTSLLNDINKALAELKADGTIDAIIEKYIPSK